MQTLPNKKRPHRWTTAGMRLFAFAPLVFTLAACSQPQAQPGAETQTGARSASTAPPLAAAPKRESPGALSQETREALKREYRQLALKNDCSQGMLPKLVGSWRFIGESKTPGFTDTLTIDAKGRFSEVLTGEPDGKKTRADIQGEMRCTFKNRVLLQVDRVLPEGAFGNRSGDHYPCDLLGDVANTGNKMLMICYFEWDVRTSAGLEFEYERVAPAAPPK